MSFFVDDIIVVIITVAVERENTIKKSTTCVSYLVVGLNKIGEIFVFCIIIIIHHRQFFKLVVCRVANSHEKKLMV